MALHRKPAALALAVALASLAPLSHAENVSAKLRINGFATAGASWVTDDFNSLYNADTFLPRSGTDENGNFTDANVLGIQLNYALDDQYDLVGQLVSKGIEGYETRADWAYIAYKASDRLRVRAGRFAAPFFLFSDNRNVGQAYAWATLPVELYGAVPLDSIDGLDLLYRQPLGGWNLDAQLTAGGSRDDNSALRNTAALNVALSSDTFTLRAGYTVGKLDLILGKNPFGTRTQQLGYLMDANGVDLDLNEGRASFADIGAIYDDGTWLVAAEFGQRRVAGWVSDLDAGYLTVGHYAGKWLPYVMYAKSDTKKGGQCLNDLSPALANATAAATAAFITYGGASPEYAAAAANAQAVGGVIYSSCAGSEQTSYSVGVRYDATKQVSMKLEVNHVQDFHNTQGYFTGVILTDDDSTDVVTATINTAF